MSEIGVDVSKVHKVHLMASLVTRITFSCNPCHVYCNQYDDDDGDDDDDDNPNTNTNNDRYLRAVRSSIS